VAAAQARRLQRQGAARPGDDGQGRGDEVVADDVLGARGEDDQLHLVGPGDERLAQREEPAQRALGQGGGGLVTGPAQAGRVDDPRRRGPALGERVEQPGPVVALGRVDDDLRGRGPLEAGAGPDAHDGGPTPGERGGERVTGRAGIGHHEDRPGHRHGRDHGGGLGPARHGEAVLGREHGRAGAAAGGSGAAGAAGGAAQCRRRSNG
jgi:hypothetical protein